MVAIEPEFSCDGGGLGGEAGFGGSGGGERESKELVDRTAIIREDCK